SEVSPDRAVTIGAPIANYAAYVVDADLRPVARGARGELLVGGPGVARGYLGRPDLTAEKFVANPFASDGNDPILYRTGDEVSLEGGELAFHGRIDDQVKLRGFRIELGEIEARLAALEGIAAAAVVVREDDGAQRLVAFVKPRAGAKPDRKTMRAGLLATLPGYMVPAAFEAIDDLPLLSSGKIDRKALKARPLAAASDEDAQEAPRTATEAALLAAAKRALSPQAIPFGADFFTELGGHSLIAARFLSAVRETPALARLTLQDVYALRNLRAMAAHLDRSRPAAPDANLAFDPPPLARRFWCGLGQAAAIPVVLALVNAQWIAVLVAMAKAAQAGLSAPAAFGLVTATYLAASVAETAFAIGAKWALLGRVKPGRHPLWGAYYFRWWLAERLESMAHVQWMQGTPLMRLYLRAVGARIGEDALIGGVAIAAPDLVAIGARATLSHKITIANARVEGGWLVIGKVEIGEDATVGAATVIEGDVVVGAGAQIADVTALASGARVGAGEIWEGSPARLKAKAPAGDRPAWPAVSRSSKAAQVAAFVLAFAATPAIGMAAALPAFWLAGGFGRAPSPWTAAAEALPLAFAIVIATMGFVVL
ncbi:MAG: AMP-binding protein, partial [Hyphomicrobiales bacterium]|nr:AMP-binding protein [Hyphomicrobiales bacterium]